MAKKNTKRKLIGLVSSLSNHRTYYTTKNTQNTTEKLELRKYDPIAKNMQFIRRQKRVSAVMKLKSVKANKLLIISKHPIL